MLLYCFVVFGKELGSQFHLQKCPAPPVVMKCIKAIEERGLNIEGIYRQVPAGHGKSSLRSALNQGDLLTLDNSETKTNKQMIEWTNKTSKQASMQACMQASKQAIITLF